MSHARLELGHVHDWSNKRLIDFCHYVEVRKTCKDCGIDHIEADPRDFSADALQIAFADADCARCRAALNSQGIATSWSEPADPEDIPF